MLVKNIKFIDPDKNYTSKKEVRTHLLNVSIPNLNLGITEYD